MKYLVLAILALGISNTSCLTPCSSAISLISSVIPSEAGKQILNTIGENPIVKSMCDQYVAGKIDEIKFISDLRGHLQLGKVEEALRAAKAKRVTKLPMDGGVK